MTLVAMQEPLLLNILLVSVTVNISAGIFFLLGPALLRLLLRCSEGLSDRVYMLNTQRPGLFNKIFRDILCHVILFSLGIYTSLFTDTLQRPFVGLSFFLRVGLGMAVGNYVFKTVQDYLLRRHLTMPHANFLHHVVTVFSYCVILHTQQNAIMGLIGLIFEGNLAFFAIGKMLKYLQYEKYLIYVIILFFGFLVSLITRAASPVLIFLRALRSSSPFLMDYLPLSCFFLDIIFFTMVNLWVMKTSMTSFLRSVKRHRLLVEGNGDDVVENLRLDIYSNRCIYTNGFALATDDVMNNARIQTSYLARSTIPVSNLNVNTSQSHPAEEALSEGFLEDFDLALDISPPSQPVQ